MTNTKKPIYIEVTEHEKFNKMASTTMETTQKLAKRINKLFKSTFADFHGTIIHCVPGNGNVSQQFSVEIHFKPLTAGSVDPSDDRVRAFMPIEESVKSDDIVSGIKALYGYNRTSAKFQMTEQASQILSEFMMTGLNIDPFKPSTYENFKAEYVDVPQFGQSPIMIRIINLDLTKLIKKIYGGKNENGGRVDYGVIPYGPVVPNMGNAMVQSTANWKVYIMQLDAEQVLDTAAELGLIGSAGMGGAVITATV